MLMQNPILTLAVSAAIATATLVSFPPEADAQHYRHRYGHGYPHGYGHGFGHGFGYGYGDYSRSNYGSIRIELEPKELRNEARVYVEGGRLGVVDDFDGIFQRLTLDPGKYEIEIRLDGYRTFRQQILVSSRRTYRLRHRMEPVTAAELEEISPRDATVAPPHARATEPSSSRATATSSPPAIPATEAYSRAGRGAYGPDRSGYGAVRIQVKPDQDEAQVYVDGAHAGVVDDFDGAFQRLHLPTGRHEIEVRLAGYRTFRQQVFVSPHRTQKLRHRMEPVGRRMAAQKLQPES